jgi:hypothetical protein
MPITVSTTFFSFQSTLPQNELMLLWLLHVSHLKSILHLEYTGFLGESGDDPFTHDFRSERRHWLPQVETLSSFRGIDC